MRAFFITIIIGAAAATGYPRTVDNVVEEILGNNPELKIKAKDNAALVATSKAENAPGDFSVEFSPFFESGYEGMASSELIVQQEFEFPSQYGLRSKVIDADKQQLDLEFEALRSEIATQVKLNCLNILLARDNIKLLSKQVVNSDSLLILANKMLNGSSITKLDYNRVKIEQMELKMRLLEAKRGEHEAAVTLQQLNGGVMPDLENLSYGTTPVNLVSVKDEVINNDLSLQAASMGVEASRRRVSVAKNGILPNIALGYRMNTELHENLHGFLVGVSVPLFSYSRNVKAAKLDYEAKSLQQENEVLKTSADIDMQLQNLKMIQEKMNIYDLGLLKESAELLFTSVTLGNMTMIQYFQEANAIYDKWEEYNNLLNEYERGLVQLRRNVLVTP